MSEANLLTAEHIAKMYSAMLDSVDLIKQYRIEPPDYLSNEEVEAVIQHNMNHLKSMIDKPYWTIEDMTLIKELIK